MSMGSEMMEELYDSSITNFIVSHIIAHGYTDEGRTDTLKALAKSYLHCKTNKEFYEKFNPLVGGWVAKKCAICGKGIGSLESYLILMGGKTYQCSQCMMDVDMEWSIRDAMGYVSPRAGCED